MVKSVITLLKAGNRVVVEPTTPEIKVLLHPHLSFTATRILYGLEAKLAKTTVELQDYNCYCLDHKDRIATTWGFWSKLHTLLQVAGYQVVVQDLQPHPNPAVFEPQWDRLLDPRWNIQLRPGQEDFLVKLASNLQDGTPCRFDCPPGYGKSTLIAFAGRLYPLAKIHVISKRVAVLRDRIYPELVQMIPGVGIIGGGKKTTGRVQCFTVDSLNHSDGKADIVFFDEVHEAAADGASQKLARYSHAIMLGFSATHDMRMDGKDMRVEAMFGPVVYRMPYSEAVASGLVVPIEVHWSDVNMNSDPVGEEHDTVRRKCLGIWTNEYRNRLIANNARADVAAGLQTLITCETLEHVLHLRKLLPEFAMVYSEQGCSFDSKRYFETHGLWPADEGVMTPEKRAGLTQRFESGNLRGAVCTTVWNVGVSFNHLGVLNRADAGGSAIMDTQIPGRVSRKNEGIDKQKGIVRDYLDQFNSGFKNRANQRRINYINHGWVQVDPVRPALTHLYRGR